MYRATSCANDVVYAVKKIHRTRDVSEKWASRMASEIEAHRAASGSEFVCKFVESVETDDGVFVVMELCDGTQLFDIVAQSKLSESDARNVFRQLVSGVDAIHRCGYSHRDLKPENVLVDELWSVKIVDFGAAKKLIIDPAHELGRCCLHASVSGTTAWNATPERGFGEIESSASDVFALGSILFFMVTGRAPFRNLEIDEDDGTVIDRVIEEDLKWSDSNVENLSDEIRNLVEWLMEKEAAERPTVEQIREHAWMEAN